MYVYNIYIYDIYIYILLYGLYMDYKPRILSGTSLYSQGIGGFWEMIGSFPHSLRLVPDNRDVMAI